MAGRKIRVLLVEDNPGDARLLEEMLSECGNNEFVVKRAASLREASGALVQDGIQVILLDLGLPDENGIQTLRRILPQADDAPIVVITGLQDEDTAVAAVKEGAQDYLIKHQVEGRQLCRVIRYAIERQEMQAQLRNLSLQDELTGLHNRKGFLVLAEQQMKVARRNQSSCMLLFFDLDGLKKINDTFGHEEGNHAIREAAGLLRSTLRQCDILARLGGDEFVALTLGATSSAEAVIRANLQAKLDEHNSRCGCPYRLSFSLGAVPCDPRGQFSVTELLEKADKLMYQEKKRKVANASK